MDEVINPHESNAFKSVSDCVLISRSHRFRATKLPAISAPSSSHRSKENQRGSTLEAFIKLGCSSYTFFLANYSSYILIVSSPTICPSWICCHVQGLQLVMALIGVSRLIFRYISFFLLILHKMFVYEFMPNDKIKGSLDFSMSLRIAWVQPKDFFISIPLRYESHQHSFGLQFLNRTDKSYGNMPL